ncbi:MAG TPA: dihydrolipoamide acetyltransferase family protein [Trueperaceae bacterium]|nr:dihydrolipoamide acetyltransferase family protein [Trueperaceae bacterium]
MAREFRLPELAESVVEGEILRWMVAEGDAVEQDQPIVEVMTDKVTVELPSPYAGVLQKQLVAEGDVVPVNEPIALFADGAEAPAAEPSAGVQAAEERSIVEPGGADEEDDGSSLSLFRPNDQEEEGAGGVTVRVRGGAAVAPRTASEARSAPRARGPYGRVLAVPAARRLARELDVDIEEVAGSGPNGRIRVDDVRAHAGRGSGAGAATAGPPSRYVGPQGYAEREERIPLRGLRRVISKQMLASHLQTVRTLHVDEADVSALVALRRRLKPIAENRGVRLSYLPFVMKAVVSALQAFPQLNASLDEASGEIVRKHYYNIGMAVATEAGLTVPVVHDVDRLTILEVAAEVNRLAAAARDNTLTQDDVRAGTFSVTNIGSLGGLFSFPIINVPEAAILGVHSIKRRPVVLEDDSIVARDMLYLSLSFDHRLVDGAEGALFTGRVIELLETPEEMMLDL